MVVEKRLKDFYREEILVKRMDIAYVDLPKYEDDRDNHIQTGKRPCVIVSNDDCNGSSPVITVIPITARDKVFIPTHLYLNDAAARLCGLNRASVVLGEGLTSVSKKRILGKIGTIKNRTILEGIERVMLIQLGMMR